MITALTPKSYFPAYLFIVDRYSRMPKLRGLRRKRSRDVVEALKWYISKFGSGGDINLVSDVERIRADA